MKQELEVAIAQAITELFAVDVVVELTRPDAQFGDFATNVALQLSKSLGQNPRVIAEALAVKLRENSSKAIHDVTVAGPGFLNITLTDVAVVNMIEQDISKTNTGKRILLEYSCPNAFKELHTGHLYQTIAGDSIGRLMEATGAQVYRANFGGDVGLHVAKCLYGAIQTLGSVENHESISAVRVEDRPEWLSKCYVAGARAYEDDESAKEEIAAINGQVYGFHTSNDHESDLAKIYWECREWSYSYFRSFYERIDAVAFDKYYPESTTVVPGLKVVHDNTPGTFQESEGAVVFKGESIGLFTNVFITSKGLPAYGAKDLGVVVTEYEDFPYDQRILMTGNDQTEYMRVIFAALAGFNPELAAKQIHHPNGTIKFASGKKMSSRLGNVTRAVDVLNVVGEIVEAENEQTKRDITLGAIKYSFLKHRIGGDIAFDITESVRLEGNSGPYLQYAHTRARSILQKRQAVEILALSTIDFDDEERVLLKKLSEYAEIVVKASSELMPHVLCTYLYELAQVFNRFYENNRVVDDPREVTRLTLVTKYADTLKNGLELLGIHAPDTM